MTVRDTLLLDQGYQPLRVIPWQRALCMQFTGKVEVVSAHDWKARTVTRDFEVPAVVRLVRSVKVRPMYVRFSRENVYLRDGYRCQYCDGQFRHRDLTLDHVVPRCHGGRTTWKNIVACCVRCNRKKGSLSPEEAGMPLKSKPSRPRWLAPRVFHQGQNTLPAVWRDWLH
ncbi:MAG: HNH endonuclease [Nannocystaceae bacterium]|nr:HNH endonuclease [bacterium]